ncbi:hypothetical protein GCM10025867_51600 (plasmid) [Frondihabitans sucicola]|uniref:DUF1838 domain-containing protein n=1 Tax=Frondihabitans sucicola TaxID=1268041 RepID=A0ABN6Y868_9MICO|nr:hypothetical protein [Frondihabitans sucicola]BDZ52352.1 hypothetical protein GCM10025867_45930 [Frondihabitans sucicola]BDZ52919.1 hypothetical protein GCM10025867_51600 [Frondihabitans sucicola]
MRHIFCTLTETSNKYIETPATGYLEIFEESNQNTIISAVWRGVNDTNDGIKAPVEVRDFAFEYTGEHPNAMVRDHFDANQGQGRYAEQGIGAFADLPQGGMWPTEVGAVITVTFLNDDGVRESASFRQVGEESFEWEPTSWHSAHRHPEKLDAISWHLHYDRKLSEERLAASAAQ